MVIRVVLNLKAAVIFLLLGSFSAFCADGRIQFDQRGSKTPISFPVGTTINRNQIEIEFNVYSGNTIEDVNSLFLSRNIASDLRPPCVSTSGLVLHKIDTTRMKAVWSHIDTIGIRWYTKIFLWDISSDRSKHIWMACKIFTTNESDENIKELVEKINFGWRNGVRAKVDNISSIEKNYSARLQENCNFRSFLEIIKFVHSKITNSEREILNKQSSDIAYFKLRDVGFLDEVRQAFGWDSGMVYYADLVFEDGSLVGSEFFDAILVKGLSDIEHGENISIKNIIKVIPTPEKPIKKHHVNIK